MKSQQSPGRKAERSEGAFPATPSSAKKSPPIVGIGASAGGLEAFTHLLQHLPADTGMAFVLVQHLDPGHESALVEILARTTAMPVREVTDKVVGTHDVGKRCSASAANVLGCAKDRAHLMLNRHP